MRLYLTPELLYELILYSHPLCGIEYDKWEDADAHRRRRFLAFMTGNEPQRVKDFVEFSRRVSRRILEVVEEDSVDACSGEKLREALSGIQAEGITASCNVRRERKQVLAGEEFTLRAEASLLYRDGVPLVIGATDHEHSDTDLYAVNLFGSFAQIPSAACVSIAFDAPMVECMTIWNCAAHSKYWDIHVSRWRADTEAYHLLNEVVRVFLDVLKRDNQINGAYRHYCEALR